MFVKKFTKMFLKNLLHWKDIKNIIKKQEFCSKKKKNLGITMPPESG